VTQCRSQCATSALLWSVTPHQPLWVLHWRSIHVETTRREICIAWAFKIKAKLLLFSWSLKLRGGNTFRELLLSFVRIDHLLRPYYKSDLELKSNSSEILPVNWKFICDSSNLNWQTSNLRSLSLTFSTKRKDMNTGKLAVNWQNFARVRLQIKFAFIIRPLVLWG